MIVVVDFLLDGEFRGTRGQVVHIQNELQVLLSKAHQYAELASDPELMTWTRSVALVVAKLRSDSIWSNGLNISEKIDALVRNMSRRDGAIYSMLPSQQDALGRNLLDPRQEAVVLQMPTSSGKTLMAELAAVQTLSSYADAKVIYLTPTRALATQTRRTLGADLSELDILVTAAGSAFEEGPFEMALLQEAKDVVVSTPEKMDLLLRAHVEWFANVRLVIVDEAHLLRDGERGVRLELLLANIRREHPHVRLLLLTPFVENAQAIAAWLSDGRGQEVDVRWRPSRLAFHHSALSGELRYLVEHLASLGTLDYIAATTTLAQGMNFPVSSVVIHSVHKPRAGALSPGEFWNIAGRAGRVGLSEKGIVVFANPKHGEHWERYTAHLSDRIDSALTEAMHKISETDTVKWTYARHESVRPFIQYLGHAVASLGIRETRSDLERLVSASLAGKSAQTRDALLRFARRYLTEVANKDRGYMKTADQTGLASFSFDQLYASIGGDPILRQGDAAVLQGTLGLKHLIDALAKLPELSLALENGSGAINTALVAEVVHKWMNGASIQEIAPAFSGDDEAQRVREAGKYVFGKVSQTVSWGAHAYLRGRSMHAGEASQPSDERQMLPAYIQYGVNSPGSAMAAMLGVPRQAAIGLAAQYTARHGDLQPDQGSQFRAFLETSAVEVWRDALSGTRLRYFSDHGDDDQRVTCPITGLRLRRIDARADYMLTPFRELVRQFRDAQGWDMATAAAAVSRSADAQTTAKFRDPNVADAFRLYHHRRAKVRVVSKSTTPTQARASTGDNTPILIF